jgi:hypothetical protein
MKQLYWHSICPFCNQGRLFLYKRLDLDKLYLHCEECERGYNNIEEISVDKSFSTLDVEFDSNEATEVDILLEKFDPTIFNKINDD